MSVLTELRTEIADALAPLGITTYTHIPGRLNLPAAFVMAGSPYLEQGQTFGEKNVRFTVVLATQTGDNQSETSALDELIEEAQAALEEAGWIAETVSQPNAADLNDGSQFLATEINVTTGVTFNS